MVGRKRILVLLWAVAAGCGSGGQTDSGTTTSAEPRQLAPRHAAVTQAFVADGALITGFHLEVERTGDRPEGDFELVLHAVTPLGELGPVLGVHRQPATFTGTEERFQFDPSISVTPGRAYAVRAKLPAGVEISERDLARPLGVGRAYDPWNREIPGWLPITALYRGGGETDPSCESTCNGSEALVAVHDPLDDQCTTIAVSCPAGCEDGACSLKAPGLSVPLLEPPTWCSGDEDADGVGNCDDDCPLNPGPLAADGCPGCNVDIDGFDSEQASSVQLLTSENALGGAGMSDGGVWSTSFYGVVEDVQEYCKDGNTLVEYTCSTTCLDPLPPSLDLVEVFGDDASLYQDYACTGDPRLTPGTIGVTEVDCPCGCKEGKCNPEQDQDNDGLVSCIDDDDDGDGVLDDVDNCPFDANATQTDADGDGMGEACDPCDLTPGTGDGDYDGVCDDVDNCTTTHNADQGDLDGDGVGDACDSCPEVPNVGDGSDFDGVDDACDVCVGEYDPDQADCDGDGEGNACDCDDWGCPTASLDCGGTCSASCDFRRVSGTIVYEKSNAFGSAVSELRPVRNVLVRLVSHEGEWLSLKSTTDDVGYFQIDVPEGVGVDVPIVVQFEAAHWAGRMFEAFNFWCDERVRFEATGPALTANQDVTFDVTVGGAANNAVGETFGYGGFCTGIVDPMQASTPASFLNILEAIRIGRTYLDEHRDGPDADLLPDDTDAVSVFAAAHDDVLTYPGQWDPVGTYTEVVMDRAFFPGSAGFRDWAVVHEFSHHWKDEISSRDDAFSGHEICGTNDEEFVFEEGFADYFGYRVQAHQAENGLSPILDVGPLMPSGIAFTGLETTVGCGVSPNVEMAVAKSVWDFADGHVGDGTILTANDDDPVPDTDGDGLGDFGGVDLENLVVLVMDDELDFPTLFDAPDVCDLAKGLGDRVGDQTPFDTVLITEQGTATCP